MNETHKAHALSTSSANYSSGLLGHPRVCYDEDAKNWRIYVDIRDYTKQSVHTFDGVREATVAWMETRLEWERA